MNSIKWRRTRTAPRTSASLRQTTILMAYYLHQNLSEHRMFLMESTAILDAINLDTKEGTARSPERISLPNRQYNHTMRR